MEAVGGPGLQQLSEKGLFEQHNREFRGCWAVLGAGLSSDRLSLT